MTCLWSISFRAIYRCSIRASSYRDQEVVRTSERVRLLIFAEN